MTAQRCFLQFIGRRYGVLPFLERNRYFRALVINHGSAYVVARRVEKRRDDGSDLGLFCEAAPDTWEENAVRSNMEMVARWQIGNPEAAKGIRSPLDRIIGNPPKAKLQFGSPGCCSRWCWSDALFMAPPVYVQMSGYTGDEKYLWRMDAEYKAAVDYLYDRDAGLFFRDSRYFKQKAANGKKMFWSRGTAG